MSIFVWFSSQSSGWAAKASWAYWRTDSLDGLGRQSDFQVPRNVAKLGKRLQAGWASWHSTFAPLNQRLHSFTSCHLDLSRSRGFDYSSVIFWSPKLSPGVSQMTTGTGPLIVESGVCEMTELCCDVMSTSDKSPSLSTLFKDRWPSSPVRGVVTLTSLSRYIVVESPLVLLVHLLLVASSFDDSFLSGDRDSTWNVVTTWSQRGHTVTGGVSKAKAANTDYWFPPLPCSRGTVAEKEEKRQEKKSWPRCPPAGHLQSPKTVSDWPFKEHFGQLSSATLLCAAIVMYFSFCCVTIQKFQLRKSFVGIFSKKLVDIYRCMLFWKGTYVCIYFR